MHAAGLRIILGELDGVAIHVVHRAHRAAICAHHGHVFTDVVCIHHALLPFKTRRRSAAVQACGGNWCTNKKKDFESIRRSIHKLFQPFFLEKAHGYCAMLLYIALSFRQKPEYTTFSHE
jgi:hypothetical protein